MELAYSEDDKEMLDGISRECEEIIERLDDMEFHLTLSGEYDHRDAIIALHAGAGGVDSQDWASMLLRMYISWAERKGFKSEVLDLSSGEEAGVKSVVMQVSGDYAYGHLRAEKGVHRLVRISPFDNDHARHTSFALAEVLPRVEEGLDVDINPDDLRVDVFRAGGHGGQNVQKNSTAIRITHIPSNTVVTCQNERSQHKNKASAIKVLKSRLYELEQEKQDEEKKEMEKQKKKIEWGSQIRSYVLDQSRIKDLRTGVETGNPQAVLDGNLRAFIEASLKQGL